MLFYISHMSDKPVYAGSVTGFRHVEVKYDPEESRYVIEVVEAIICSLRTNEYLHIAREYTTSYPTGLVVVCPD